MAFLASAHLSIKAQIKRRWYQRMCKRRTRRLMRCFRRSMHLNMATHIQAMPCMVSKSIARSVGREMRILLILFLDSTYRSGSNRISIGMFFKTSSNVGESAADKSRVHIEARSLFDTAGNQYGQEQSCYSRTSKGYLVVLSTPFSHFARIATTTHSNIAQYVPTISMPLDKSAPTLYTPPP
jgi:hypothetical protein